MRIVVVANSTTEPLAARLPDHDVVCSGVGDLHAWLALPGTPASDPATELVVVLPDADALLPPLGPVDATDELMDLIEKFAHEHSDRHLLIATLLASPRAVSSYADAARVDGRFAAVARWNLRLAELAATAPNVTVLDLSVLLERVGRTGLTNAAYWYLGRIRWSSEAFAGLGVEIDRVARTLVTAPRKVLVLDLDNTLWGGVLGEDGIEGIALAEDGVGKCFRDFQQQLRRLRHDGTLLAVISKNDQPLVDELLATHPMMVLRPDDFVAVIADWGNKAEHLEALAGSLGLGLDAFVFIDDHPVERELIRSQFPEVAVPEFPERPELLSDWLVDEVVPAHFTRLRILDEDRTKTEQYRARELRRTASETNPAAFLASLDIRLTFRRDDRQLASRLSQLTQKTNQFNLTTERMTTGEIGALVDDPAWAVIACDYEDRFGPEGTIGLAILHVGSGTLRNLLLSCRVLGRGVEGQLLAEVEQLARAAGCTELHASFIPTDRNTVASTFLNAQGFVDTGDPGAWRGKKELQ